MESKPSTRDQIRDAFFPGGIYRNGRDIVSLVLEVGRGAAPAVALYFGATLGGGVLETLSLAGAGYFAGTPIYRELNEGLRERVAQ